jgi:hypothetical protein
MDSKKVTPESRAEFEKKFMEIRKHTRHTVESLTVYAGEYIRELEQHLIQRNGQYDGKVVSKS